MLGPKDSGGDLYGVKKEGERKTSRLEATFSMGFFANRYERIEGHEGR